MQKLLEQIGVERDRIHMVNLSSAMGPQFAQYATEMTEHILALGPSPLQARSTDVAAQEETDSDK